MKKLVKALLFAVMLCGLFIVNANAATNPVIKDAYTADPAALVHGDTVYLYVGHDQGHASSGYVLNEWKVYSSKDMENWTDCGVPLTVSEFSWARGDAWAGQVIYRNGKFYWYICAEHIYGGKAIGIAVSDSPTGPFKDALGHALITNNMTSYTGITWDDIDPTVWIDDDGQAYLYWGNTALMYVKLNDDMISYSGGIVNVTDQFPSYTEAPWMYKRNGLYYMVYAMGWPEQIAYATSTSPTGPWTYRGVISDLTGTNCGTQHASVIEFKGQWYYISHNDALVGGSDYSRSVYIEKFTHNADGTIPLIPMTSTGVSGKSSSIQSYNYQSMYWRHYYFGGRMDANVVPVLDGQWQIVPGLANSGAGYVSFESVNFPGRYLRHYDYALRVDKNDGSRLFAEDATFKMVNGFADSSWTSFQSYNFPDRYIRHFNYELRIDPISTWLDQQDATFKIINN